MKNIKLYILLVVAAVFTFYSCEEDLKPLNTNFVTFGDSSYSALVDPGSSTTVDITVYAANVTGNDRSISINVDGTSAAAGSFNVPATVIVPGGTNKGVLTVQLNDPGIAQNAVTIQLVEEEGLFVGEPTTIVYTQSCNEVAVTLDFTFDYYSSETSWEILDSNEDTILTGGGYSDGIGSATENFNLCQSRSYTLIVYDAYGDGMNDGTNLGSYTLTIGGVAKVTGGGNFGASESNAFDTN